MFLSFPDWLKYNKGLSLFRYNNLEDDVARFYRAEYNDYILDCYYKTFVDLKIGD